jgi:hypothetical protein
MRMRSAPSVPWIRRRTIRRISWCGIGIDSQYNGLRVRSREVIAIGAPPAPPGPLVPPAARILVIGPGLLRGRRPAVCGALDQAARAATVEGTPARRTARAARASGGNGTNAARAQAAA